MSASLPELDTYAIRFVVRQERTIPPCAALVALALMLLLGWRIDMTARLIAAPLVSALAWCGARLLVEIVAVVADTLLPR